ncbi:hypothetical protein [Dinoroseobacter sp. S124A]|uniref:hypothetical protein n=1 Tax=Dinoroseobacter sp. S124A TaxID=3415128 RepID=UPI003C7DD377
MHISELIEQLAALEGAHGDLLVQTDSGEVIEEVDVWYEDSKPATNPTCVVIK